MSRKSSKKVATKLAKTHKQRPVKAKTKERSLADMKFPIRLIRLVVQVEDTKANQLELSAAKVSLIQNSKFEGIENVIKMEQLAVISLRSLNS